MVNSIYIVYNKFCQNYHISKVILLNILLQNISALIVFPHPVKNISEFLRYFLNELFENFTKKRHWTIAKIFLSNFLKQRHIHKCWATEGCRKFEKISPYSPIKSGTARKVSQIIFFNFINITDIIRFYMNFVYREIIFISYGMMWWIIPREYAVTSGE